MKRIVPMFIVFFGLASCAQKPPPVSRAVSAVGDIAFDPSVDDPAFRLCDSARVFQYYNTESYFLDHKDSIRRCFLSRFIPVAGVKGQSGFITVKFIINCDGLTGRYRLSEMDSSYQPYHFDPMVSGQLLSLVKGLSHWEPALYKGRYYDSYQYITFRMRDGHILTISP